MNRLAIVFFGLGLALASPARADNTKDAARAFKAGLAANEAQDYKAAITHFTRAYDLAPHHFALYNIAVAYEKLGQFRQAAYWYNEYREKAPANLTRERAEVERAIKELKKKPSRVMMKTSPAGARVLVDGQPIGTGPVERLVYGGDHRVRAELDGESYETQVSLEFGEPKTVELVIPPPPGGFRNAQRTSTPKSRTEVDPADPGPTSYAPTPAASATTGTLAITGLPEGALISIDERVVGRVPATFFLEQGAHQLQISSLGYLRYERPVAIRAGEVTQVEAKLQPGDTSEAQDLNTRPFTVGYFFGANAGLDAEGNGGAGNVSFGVAVGRVAFAVRYGRTGGVTAVESFLRVNLLPTRLTPFLGLGYSRGTLRLDTDGDMIETELMAAGFALIAGLRFDVAKSDRTRVSVTAESGARFYPDFSDVRGADGEEGYGRIVPLYVGLELVYGSVK